MDILVYVYAGLFALTFAILIGLYVWLYKLSKEVKNSKNKNPYEAFLGSPRKAQEEERPQFMQHRQQEPPQHQQEQHRHPQEQNRYPQEQRPHQQQPQTPRQEAVDLYRDFKMR